MYISKKTKEIIKNKYNGRCAYSGTILMEDWQIDHLEPIRRNPDGSCLHIENDNIKNLMPCQKIINNYKHSMYIELFKKLIITLPHRIAKLPKNPRTKKSIKRKAYMLEIARLFNDFKGKFYYETI